MASLTTTTTSDTITIGNNTGIQVDVQRSNDNIILSEINFERILDVVRQLEGRITTLECEVKEVTKEKDMFEEEATKDRKELKETLDICETVLTQRKFTEGYCYKSNTGKTIIQIIERMEYDPVNKKGTLKVKDLSTNIEKTVFFLQHLSEAFRVEDWQETIVLGESMNYDGILIVSFNTSAPNKGNSEDNNTPNAKRKSNRSQPMKKKSIFDEEESDEEEDVFDDRKHKKS